MDNELKFLFKEFLKVSFKLILVILETIGLIAFIYFLFFKGI